MQPALLITSESPMSATKDIEEIKACIYEETASFQRKDFDAWAECWSHSEDTVCIWQDPEMGLNVNDGWEAVSATTKSGMERYPKKLNTKFTHQSHKIILHGDFARVTFEQIAENLEGDALELVTHSLEIRTMVREPEGWKISFVSFYPLKGSMHRNNQVEVTPDGRVLWASEEAKALLTTHPALMISHGKLRARTLQSNKVLREAISRAEKLQDIFDLRQFMKDTGGDAVFPVVLGEDSEGSLQICFIHVLDGSIYVLIDDKARVGSNCEGPP